MRERKFRKMGQSVLEKKNVAWGPSQKSGCLVGRPTRNRGPLLPPWLLGGGDVIFRMRDTEQACSGVEGRGCGG